MKPLQGIGVLVTRPAEQADRLLKMIRDLGGAPQHLPVIAIVEMGNSLQIDEKIRRLLEFDVVIFISANAVHKVIRYIDAHGGLPEKLSIACVGAATANALRQFGAEQVIYPKQQFNSEALLDLPVFQSVQRKKILIIRGEGGRDLLAK